MWLRGPELAEVFAPRPHECVERAKIAAETTGSKTEMRWAKLEACPALTRVFLMTTCGYWFILILYHGLSSRVMKKCGMPPLAFALLAAWDDGLKTDDCVTW